MADALKEHQQRTNERLNSIELQLQCQTLPNEDDATAASNKTQEPVVDDFATAMDAADVELWLRETVQLPQYTKLLSKHGIDDMETVADISKQDLEAVGITDREHQRKILKSIVDLNL